MNAWYLYLAWGALGSISIELLDFHAAVKKWKTLPWDVPGEAPLNVFIIAFIVRVLIGALAAVGLGVAGLTTAVGGFVTGIAAPRLIEHYRSGKQLDVAQPADPERPDQPTSSTETKNQQLESAPSNSSDRSDDDDARETRVNNV